MDPLAAVLEALPLDSEHSDAWRLAREMADREIAPGALERDRRGRIPRRLLQRLAEAGFLGMLASEEAGGAGFDERAYVLALMEFARADPSVSVLVAVHNMVVRAIGRRGRGRRMRAALRSIAAGRAVGAFALTEAGAGSDAAAISARAEPTAAGHRLSGRKVFVTNGRVARWILTFATVDPARGRDGITAFLLRRGMPGLSVAGLEDKMGLRASDTARLALDGCEIPADLRLGEEGEGFAIAMEALDAGRIGIAAQACGIAAACLEAAARYASERRQFGRPIADFQAIQAALADTATDLEASVLLTLQAAASCDRGEAHAAAASRAKLFASEAAVRASYRMGQVFGGYGYVKDFPVEKLYRDARVVTLYEGTSEVQRIVIAKESLG